ncbi:hypothetical protein KBH77_01845 [Patescibacteria group bacterium]|nr:hypothetical protein [Patescibacteria group bacterium]
MSIEKFFPKKKIPTYNGELEYNSSYTGFHINCNPKDKFEGIVNSVVRMINNPKIDINDLEYCIDKNAQSLNITSEDLLLIVEDKLNTKADSNSDIC